MMLSIEQIVSDLDAVKPGRWKYHGCRTEDDVLVKIPFGHLRTILAALSATPSREGEVGKLREQIEYLTGVPSAPGQIGDFRAPDVDAAIIRSRAAGDEETAQVLARFRLAYREREIAFSALLSAALATKPEN